MEQEAILRDLLQLREHVVGPIRKRDTPSPKAFIESKDFRDGIAKELDRQRQNLSSLFSSGFPYFSQGYYKDSLPKNPSEIKKHLGIPLAPVIIDPRISIQTVVVLTSSIMNCEPSDITNWKEGGVLSPTSPYIAWLAVDRGRNLPQAKDEYKNHSFFRGATLLEGLFVSLVLPDVLFLDQRIFTLGSRIENIYIPSIGTNSKGGIEVGNPILPLDNRDDGASVLVAAR